MSAPRTLAQARKRIADLEHKLQIAERSLERLAPLVDTFERFAKLVGEAATLSIDVEVNTL